MIPLITITDEVMAYDLLFAATLLMNQRQNTLTRMYLTRSNVSIEAQKRLVADAQNMVKLLTAEVERLESERMVIHTID